MLYAVPRSERTDSRERRPDVWHGKMHGYAGAWASKEQVTRTAAAVRKPAAPRD